MGKFNVGDRVFDLQYGVGEVIRIAEYTEGQCRVRRERSVKVRFGLCMEIDYTSVGKHYDYELNPILWTVEEAIAKGYDVPKSKKKVVKEIKRWANVYGDCVACNDYVSREDADNHARIRNRVACVELTGTYEIEVEE
jgi:hypothetical protein